MIQDISAFILAGGISNRLGYPKAVLRINNKFLIEFVREKLSTIFRSVHIISPIASYIRMRTGLEIIPDIYPNLGPIGGIYTGIKNMKTQWGFFWAVDMPFPDTKLIETLCSQIYKTTNEKAIIPEVRSYIQPLCSIFSKNSIPELEDYISSGDGYISIKGFLDNIIFKKIPLSEGQEVIFKDIDSLEDIKYLQEQGYSIGTLPVIRHPIKKIKKDKEEEIYDWIVRETFFEVAVNKVKFASVSCLDMDIEEFVYGFLLFTGLILTREDIKSVNIEENSILINIKNTVEEIIKSRPGVIFSGCGGNRFRNRKLNLVNKDTVLTKEEILLFLKSLKNFAPVFQVTGCTHQAGIKGKDWFCIREDIGRHTAVDKAIGYLVLEDKISQADILGITGRITGEIVIKAIRAQIPIIASLGSPSAYAIELADKYNITLIGFARFTRMNIYTHNYRVSLSN